MVSYGTLPGFRGRLSSDNDASHIHLFQSPKIRLNILDEFQFRNFDHVVKFVSADVRRWDGLAVNAQALQQSVGSGTFIGRTLS